MILQLALITLIALCTNGNPSNTTESAMTYGDAEIQTIVRLDPSVQIYCNLKDMPPVIGSNIPVCINGLRPASDPKDNLSLMIFLNDLLLSKKNPPEQILLKDIRRGEQFCLIADVYVDGRNLCDLMVEQNLATKVIEVVDPTGTVISNDTGTKETSPQNPAAAGQYVASKNSKVYHWADCPHAKRMDAAKAIYFVNPEDAVNSGRRPCKTCNPE